MDRDEALDIINQLQIAKGIMIVEMLHPLATPDHVGDLPAMLCASNPEPAAKQFDHNYAHGGGWHPQQGYTLNKDWTLQWPGDPVLLPLARMHLRNEMILIYEHGVVAIIQPDRSFEVCRMD